MHDVQYQISMVGGIVLNVAVIDHRDWPVV